MLMFSLILHNIFTRRLENRLDISQSLDSFELVSFDI